MSRWCFGWYKKADIKNNDGTRPKQMEEYYEGGHGLQKIVVPEKKKKKTFLIITINFIYCNDFIQMISLQVFTQSI